MKKSILFCFLSSIILILIIFGASGLLFAAPVDNPPPVEKPAPAKEEAPVEQVWVRDHPMTCYQVWVNKDNNFEFVFWWEYKSSNWVKIYDMAGNEVFSIDMPFGNAHFIANLPDGMYTVKTFHDGFEKAIQEFIIGKPPVRVAIMRTYTPIISEGGEIERDSPGFGLVRVGYDPNHFYVGDNFFNRRLDGYLSYDISGLALATRDNIQYTSLEFNIWQILGNPSTLGSVWVEAVDYGARPIVGEDINLPGLFLQLYPGAGDGNFTVTADSLKTALQNAIATGKSRFQIRVHTALETNGNHFDDKYEYRQSDIYLTVGLVY